MLGGVWLVGDPKVPNEVSSIVGVLTAPTEVKRDAQRRVRFAIGT